MNAILDSFSHYLKSLGLSTHSRDSYVSDVRQFLIWVVGSVYHQDQTSFTEPAGLLDRLDASIISLYTSNLQSAAISDNTVARKISALKKFFDFAYRQQWTSSNLGKFFHTSLFNNKKIIEEKKLIDEFAEYLRQEGVGSQSRLSYLSDTHQFIDWLKEK